MGALFRSKWQQLGGTTMTDPSRVIIQLLSVVAGLIILQTPMYWVAHRYSTSYRDDTAVLSHKHNSSSLNSLTSESVIEIPEDFQSQSSDPESVSFKVGGSKPDRRQHRESNFRALSVAHHAFVLFNTYRYSPQTFYLLGSTSVIVRKFENELPVYRCEWVPRNGSQFELEKSITTDAQMLYVGFDENSSTYVPAVVNCTFNQTVGENNSGGVLRLHMSKGPSFWEPHYTIETVFEEKPRSVRSEVHEGKQHKYAFCGPPIYTNSRTTWIETWLAYHHFIWRGSSHFYFYDVGGLDDAGKEILAPWVKANVLTIVNAFGGEAYPSWYRNQVLFQNDCLYRARSSAKWVFFHDLDELVHVPAPNTLESLLEENKDSPWMSFGSMAVDLSHCREERWVGEWSLERMLWREKQPVCTGDKQDPWMCVAASGRRKVAVNPQKVMLVGVHRTAIPETGGINFNGSIARLHHYHKVLKPGEPLCNVLVNDSGPESLQFDDDLASRVPEIRKFADTLLAPRSM